MIIFCVTIIEVILCRLVVFMWNNMDTKKEITYADAYQVYTYDSIGKEGIIKTLRREN